MNIDILAKSYAEYMTSFPFDVGQATKNGLGSLIKANSAKKARLQAVKYNSKSASNGTLMKIAPLAVWTSTLTDIEDIKEAVTKDVSLMHPHPFVHECILVYCVAIQYLLNHPNEDKRG